MILSDEQMAVVQHGSGTGPTYEWVDLPVGPQPIPAWAKGLHINWLDQYENEPSYTVKVPKDFEPRDWPGKRYRIEGTRYLAESGDGRASCYYHSSALTLRPLKHRHRCLPVLPARPRRPDGRIMEGWYWPIQYWHEDVLCWATDQDRGFGGSNIAVPLEDGRIGVLRGPWHGPSPEGYLDCGTGRGACLISEELLLLLIARHHAHLRVARVTEHGRTRIQAVREDWDAPKAWVRERERAARKEAARG